MVIWLTGLAKVIARSGYPVVEVPGWETRGYGGGLDALEGIVCHHTAMPWTRSGDYPSLAVVRDGRSDVPGPLCNLGLGRSGTWYVVAAGRANHAGRVRDQRFSNPRSIGIEAEAAGTGDPRDWPAVQMDSYARGVAALMAADGIPAKGHKEVCDPVGRKIDPSFDMNAFRSRVSAITIRATQDEPVVAGIVEEELLEEDMRTIFVRPDGPAFLAWGNKAVGISTGEDLAALEAAGIPIAKVTVKLWDKIAAALGGVK